MWGGSCLTWFVRKDPVSTISEDEKQIKEKFDLGINEWNDSDDSNDDFLPLKKNTEERLYMLHTSLFTIEVQKKDGSNYPPASIHLLLCGLQRIMRHNNCCPFNIFDKKDVRFRGFHGTMVSVATQRRSRN